MIVWHVAFVDKTNLIVNLFVRSGPLSVYSFMSCTGISLSCLGVLFHPGFIHVSFGRSTLRILKMLYISIFANHISVTELIFTKFK